MMLSIGVYNYIVKFQYNLPLQRFAVKLIARNRKKILALQLQRKASISYKKYAMQHSLTHLLQNMDLYLNHLLGYNHHKIAYDIFIFWTITLVKK